MNGRKNIKNSKNWGACANTKSNRHHYVNKLKSKGTNKTCKLIQVPLVLTINNFPSLKAGKIGKKNLHTEKR